MQKTLLYIRLRQLNREANGLGLYMFIFLAIAVALSLVTYWQYKHGQHAYYIIILLSLVCLSIQYYRKDKQFVYKHFDNPHLQIFLEYLILTLPFSITSLITQNWFYFPALAGALMVIPFLKFQFRHRAVLKNLSNIIPASSHEWISGLRKQYVQLIIVYLAAVAFCWVRILPLGLLWFLTIIISSFHIENEPLHILREGNKTARGFLSGKIKTNIWYILVLYTLPVIINAFVVREFLTITMLFIPAQVALICFAITLKYSSYKPQTNQPGNNIAFAIVAIFSATPYFLPITAILAFIYFYKAEHTLKYYLHD